VLSRPERLVIEPAENGAFHVDSARFFGSLRKSCWPPTDQDKRARSSIGQLCEHFAWPARELACHRHETAR
jgi:hypothetical protein